jgi:hypothetical protein
MRAKLFHLPWTASLPVLRDQSWPHISIAESESNHVKLTHQSFHQSFQSTPVGKPTTNINSNFHKQSVIHFSQHKRSSSLIPHHFLQPRDPNLTSSKQRNQRSLLPTILQLRANSCKETIYLLKYNHSTNPGQGIRTNFNGLDLTSDATTTFSHPSGCSTRHPLTSSASPSYDLPSPRLVVRQSPRNIASTVCSSFLGNPKLTFHQHHAKPPLRSLIQIQLWACSWHFSTWNLSDLVGMALQNGSWLRQIDADTNRLKNGIFATSDIRNINYQS